LLEEVSSTITDRKSVQPPPAQKASSPVSPEEALEILRNEPSYESLVAVVRWLTQEMSQQGAFNIGRPSPTGSQIVQVLVTDIAPNYWDILKEDASGGSSGKKSTTLQLFLGCVRSIPGINAALLRLRALTQEAKAEKKDVKRPDLIMNLGITLDLLKEILNGADAVERIWKASSFGSESHTQRRPLEQEFVTLLGSGRLVSWAAEAAEVVRLTSHTKRGDGSAWISDGAEHSRWIGRNVAHWIACSPPPEDAKLCSQLLARSLRLGYTGSYALQSSLMIRVLLTSYL
jgi:telomere length regulation protein